jgi:hypothetical protein
MKRAEIIWFHDETSKAVVACIEDTDGHEWMASIQHEHYTIRPRLITTLICRSAGHLLSTATLSSVEEAQAWCYQKLQLE